MKQRSNIDEKVSQKSVTRMNKNAVSRENESENGIFDIQTHKKRKSNCFPMEQKQNRVYKRIHKVCL